MNLKKLCKKLLFLPLWLLILLTLPAAAGLVFVFLEGLEESPIAYPCYALAFYTLTVDVIFCVTTLPRYVRTAKKKVYENKYGNRYVTDVVFRTRVSLYLSLGINLLYVVVNLISGYLYETQWFYLLSAYYTILACMRFLLLRYFEKNSIGANLLGEWKRARICASILTLVNLALSGVVLMMMYRDRGFTYHGMLIYIMAAYTFYVTTHAVIDIVRYRKYHSPVLTTAKIITLASALVSMLSLETAMMAAFGAKMAQDDKRIMIAATGAGICVVVIAMSAYMIVRSTKEIKRYKTENTHAKQHE